VELRPTIIDPAMALFFSDRITDSLMAILIVGGGLFAYQGYRYIRRRLRSRARSWPSAEATIQSAEVAISIDGAKPEETVSSILSVGVSTYLDAQRRMQRYGPSIAWVVRVAYSFPVGSAYYGGYSDRGVSSEEAGAEYARGLQGKRFPVRYKVGNPERSVVLDDEWVAAIPSESEGAHDPFRE
jgi:hypothetical protein